MINLNHIAPNAATEPLLADSDRAMHSMPDKVQTRSESVSNPYYSKRNSSRMQIIEAASKLILEKGYHDISMKEVAVQSGVSRATLYRYYSTKEQLYTDTASYWAMNFIDNIRRHPPSADTVGDRVNELIERTVNAVANSPGLMAAYIATMVSEDPCLKADPRYQQALMPHVLKIAIGKSQSSNMDLTASVLQHILVSNLLLLNSGKVKRDIFEQEMKNVARHLLSDIWKRK